MSFTLPTSQKGFTLDMADEWNAAADGTRPHFGIYDERKMIVTPVTTFLAEKLKQ